jgi:zinc protease
MGSPTVAVQIWVKVGSLDEMSSQRGMAHFLEHMLFKGTDTRGVGEIAATIELCGGDINAYTTFDHTVFHLTLAAPHIGVGIELLADAFANSRLDPEEFAREKEVILEEIKRGLDSPAGKVGRRVFELAFAGTEAGRPIIGTAESVLSFTHEQLREFYKHWYVPSNASLVVVGDFDPPAVLELVHRSFGNLPSVRAPEKSQDPRLEALSQPISKRDRRQPQVTVLKGDYEQPRLEVTFPAPSLAHFDSAALDLAAFALGSGEMSRFNRRLRDKEGLVNSVGASVYSPMFGGLFEISALLSEEQMLPGVRGIARELMQMHESDPITPEELARARSNLKADRIFRDETVDGQARSLGYGMLTPYKLLYDEVYTSVVSAMPETAVTGALKRWIHPQEAIIVALLPNRSNIQEAEILSAFMGGVADGASASKAHETMFQAPVSKSLKPDVHTCELKPGITLIYRQNPQGQIFSLTAATEGGLRAETGSTSGLFNAMSGLLGMASQKRSYGSVIASIEGRGASLAGFSGKDSLGFHLQCLPEDMADTVAIWQETLLDPFFPDEQWMALKREIEQAIAAQGDSSATVCMRRFQEQIFCDHPYRYPLIGQMETVRAWGADFLLRHFLAFSKEGPWVIAATGPDHVDRVIDCLRVGIEDFGPLVSRRVFPSDSLVRGKEHSQREAHLSISKDREQTHIVYGFPGLTWSDADRPALDVLINILGGHGGRLFRSLRDRESLAYVVSPIVSYGYHPGAVGSYIACAPSKRTKALAMLQAEMLALGESAPTPVELERAKNHIIGTHDMGLQRSDSLTSTMSLMELYGCGFDDFERYPKLIAKVGAEDVTRVANRLFRPELAVDVTVGPE